MVRFNTVLLLASLLLVGCDNPADSRGNIEAPVEIVTSAVSVQGAGVKGPLISALVSAYQLDPNAENLLGELIDSGVTGDDAAIQDLEIPGSATGLILLEFISDDSTVDNNSGTAPVLNRLVTVIPAMQILESLVYATPLTTLAVSIAQINADSGTPPYGGNDDGVITEEEFTSALIVAGAQVVSSLGFGLQRETDIFTVPPVLNEETETPAQQGNVLAYRQAIEIFSALLVTTTESADSSNPDSAIVEDNILSALAADLSDGSLDSMRDGEAILQFTDVQDLTAILSTDPADLMIPGTDTAISELADILVGETDITGVTVDSAAIADRTVEVVLSTVRLASDIDGDSVRDADDAFPLDAEETTDSDQDGTGNNADLDDDNDGIPDADDAFPLDATESIDTDGDGEGDNGDEDDDGDGVSDSQDAFPRDSTERSDADGDGVGDNTDDDDDNDGTLDEDDAFPLDATESVDTDGDGIGNNEDTDDDGDGVDDENDAFSLNPAETLDTDGDGVGNNVDTDDDGDGLLDTEEEFPLDATKGNKVEDIEDAPTERSAIAIAQPGDSAATESDSIIQEVVKTRAISVGDDGSVLLTALLDDGRTALVRSLPVIRSLEIIAITTNFDINQFNFGTAFRDAKIARSIKNSGYLTFMVDDNLLIDGIDEAGLWAWEEGEGFRSLVKIGDACDGGGQVTELIRSRLTKNGVSQVTAACDAGTFSALIDMDGSRYFPLSADVSIDGFEDSDPPATLGDIEFLTLNDDGSVFAFAKIECLRSIKCSRFGDGGRIVRISKRGDVQVYLDTGEKITADEMRTFRIPSAGTGGNVGSDGFGRITIFAGDYADASQDSRSKPKSAGSVLRMDGNNNEFIYKFEFDNNKASGSGLTIATLSDGQKFLYAAENGDLLFRYPLDGHESGQIDGLFVHRDQGLDTLVLEQSDAVGYVNKKLENIFDVSYSPDGRAVFSAVVTDQPIIAYVEDQCVEKELFPINSDLYLKALPQFSPFSSVNLPDNPLNIEGFLLADVRGNNGDAVVLFNVPRGKCDINITINSTGDLPDINPGDGKCDTGGTVRGEDECTLRAAIGESNSLENGSAIEFDFPLQGSEIVISPTNMLPEIRRQITIKAKASMTDKVVLSGSSAGNAAGLVAQSGNLSLENFEIRDFLGSGIDANASGNVVTLRKMRLLGNGGYGVESGGPLKIEGTADLQSRISGNALGGILAEGSLRVQFADIVENLGPGIIAESTATLAGSHVDRNGAEGFVSKLSIERNAASCNKVILNTDPTIGLTRSTTFEGNAGTGIHTDPGSVSFDPGTIVNDNSGSGIIVECGKLQVNDLGRSGETQVTVNGNAKGAACMTVDEQNDYALTPTSCDGGGIELRGSFGIKSTIDDIAISDNGGFGILTENLLVLGVSTIQRNEGPGIWAVQNSDRDGAAKTFVKLTGPEVSITNNQAEGIRLDIGDLDITSNLDLRDNLGTGIVAVEGNVGISDDNKSTNVTDNGSGTANCWVWTFEPLLETVSRVQGACGDDGIVLDEGNFSSTNLTLTGHSGAGLKVSGDPDDVNVGTVGNANLLGGQVCDNAIDFDVAGTLTLDLVNQNCP